MAKKKITTFKLEEELQSKLLKANLKTVEDVLSQPFLQLMDLLRLSASETKNLMKTVSYGCLPQCQTAYELSEKEDDVILFGDHKLDQIMQGGIKKGVLLEIAGPAGVGKTQMCLHLSLQCLIKSDSNNAVCYIDTEGAVRTERFIELLQQQDRTNGREEEVMSKIYILQPTTINSFTEILESLELFCIENEIGLVIIDSIASLARKEFSKESNIHRSATLASWAAKIKALADQLQIAVVVTNQVTSRFNNDILIDEESNTENPVAVCGSFEVDFNATTTLQVHPALGTTWIHFVNTRLILQFLDLTTRQLIIAKSPVAPFTIKNFRISRAGIKFNEEIYSTSNGIDPNLHRIKVEPGLLVS